MAHTAWNREQTLMALGLYLLPPVGKRNWDDPDPQIKVIAEAIGRSGNAVCLKIANLKNCDPNRTGKGFSNGSAMDREVMAEYLAAPSETLAEAMGLLAQNGIVLCEREGVPSLQAGGRPLRAGPAVTFEYDGQLKGSVAPVGAERDARVRARVNQDYFRRNLLANYRGACCLTRIDTTALLVASHIKPWGKSAPAERTVSSNGILLNALHDKAFDKGLITLDDQYRVRVSSRLRHSESNDRWLFAYEGRRIDLPHDPTKATWPSLEFIRYHNDCIFERVAV